MKIWYLGLVILTSLSLQVCARSTHSQIIRNQQTRAYDHEQQMRERLKKFQDQQRDITKQRSLRDRFGIEPNQSTMQRNVK